ncbi:MAG: hypothetical protein RL748_179 [Pseudomonadota bacterium]|jgi:hypothetical protein
MSRLARLRFKTDIAVSQFSGAVAEQIFGARLPQLFLDYQIALHQIIRANDHLMGVAADQARRRWQQGDASCRGLFEYMEWHRQDELNHPDWLLEDIQVLGVSRESVLEAAPPAHIAALPGCQYYWIYNHHPAMLFGYMVVLEGYAMRLEDIDRYQQQTGFPAAAFRTMRLHAQEDPGHADGLYQFLDNCAFSDALFDAITGAALTTCMQMATIFKTLADKP